MFLIAALLWMVLSAFAYKTQDTALLDISLVASMICALAAYTEQRFNQIVRFFKRDKQ